MVVLLESLAFVPFLQHEAQHKITNGHRGAGFSAASATSGCHNATFVTVTLTDEKKLSEDVAAAASFACCLIQGVKAKLYKILPPCSSFKNKLRVQVQKPCTS